MSGSHSLPATASLADFDRWWRAPGDWVEPPNQRRGGESGVLRLRRGEATLYCKRQTGHLYRSWRTPFGRPTVLRELGAYRAFAGLGLRVPEVAYGAARKTAGSWQALLVTQQLNGFCSLADWYAGPAVTASGELRHAVLRRLADYLAWMHRGRWQHGCLYAKHIFVAVREAGPLPAIDIALIDLEKSRRRLTVGGAAQRDIDQLGRHRGGMPDAEWAFLRAAHRAALHAAPAAGGR